MAVETHIKWSGTEEEQKVAQAVFDLMTLRARFFSEQAPIRQRLGDLQRFFASQQSLRFRESEEELGRLIQQSLDANPQVFAREDTAGGPVYVTTRAGVPPAAPRDEDTLHTFQSRLFTGAREPTEEDLEAVRGATREIPEIIAPIPEPEAEALPPAYTAEPELIGAPEQTMPEAEELEEEMPLEQEVEEVAPPQPEVAPAPALVRLGDVIVDLSNDPDLIVAEYGDLFKQRLGQYLEEDFRFVQFGGEYYLEEHVERLSKGQLRDIKEYIEERGVPVSDEEIISDALRRPLQDASYALQRFTINFRLSRERKDFRFVGVADDRLWATTSLPPIGQSVRKASEIAQDYRYLLDPDLTESREAEPAGGEDRGRLQIPHVLTWYESENGVLGVTPALEAMLPRPLLEDQTIITLRIQDPQNYATYLAELRLGGGNRGSYIAGLEELFQSTLVPGATFTLVQGGASNELVVEYERQPAQESRILQYDDRRDRWFFAPVVYECPVDDTWLLSEDRVGALNGRKRASDAERRRPDALLALAFEVVGEPGEGNSLTALVDDLLPVVNLERPLSRRYVESIIRSPQYPQFEMVDEGLGMASYTAK